MTRPPWSFMGSYTTATVTQSGNSLTAIVPKANSSASGYIWVNPVGATRKYTFKFNVLCTTTDGVNVLGTSAKVYYEDPGSGETITLWESNPATKYWKDNGNKTVERTVVFPESFESETGRFMYSIANGSDNTTACISIYNVQITDMTTADLDNSLENFGNGLVEKIGEKIKGIFIPEEGFFDVFQNKFSVLLSEHLGFLYEAPTLVSDIFEVVGNWEPSETPSIVLPAFNFTIADTQIHLWDEQTYTFDFLNESPWSIIYGAYKTFIFVILCVAIINLAISKYHSIVGGD